MNTKINENTEEVYHRFASSVRTVRRAHNLTQRELAERAGLSKTYLVRIESGDKNLTLKTAHKLACALEMDLTSLLNGVTVTVIKSM